MPKPAVNEHDAIVSLCRLLTSAHALAQRLDLPASETGSELRDALAISRLSALRLLAERRGVDGKQR